MLTISMELPSNGILEKQNDWLNLNTLIEEIKIIAELLIIIIIDTLYSQHSGKCKSI